MPTGWRSTAKETCSLQTATAIAKIAPNGTIDPSFATGLIPTGLAFDAAGNLYAVDVPNAGKVFKITPTGTIDSVQDFTGAGRDWSGFRSERATFM